MTERQPLPTRDGSEHYDLLESIESGVLAEAWFARTPSRRRTGPALVRVLKPVPAVCADARSRDAFLEALFAQSAVHHPLLVRVLDISSRDRPYAVFELVEAIPLENLLAGSRSTSYPISLAAAVRITLDVAAALEALHAAKCAHGDVTDRSVLLAASGFGLVSPTGLGVAACRLRRELLSPSLAYKPKEQLERSQVSPQADVFALGALVFEMLAGRPVFEGEGEELLAAVSAGRVPRLDDVRSGIARPLADVVAQALSTEPGERFSSAQAFAKELETAAGPALAARADLGRLFGRVAAPDIAALRMTLTPLIEARESLASLPAREELLAPGEPERVIVDAPPALVETVVPGLAETAKPVETAKPALVETAKLAPVETAKPAPVETAKPAPVETAKPGPVVGVTPARGKSASGVLAAHLDAEARRKGSNEPSVIITDESSSTSDRTSVTKRGLRAPESALKGAARGESAPTSVPAVASIDIDTDDDVALLERSTAASRRRMIGAIAVIALGITGFALVSQLGSNETPPEPDKPQPVATAQPAAAPPAPAPAPETTPQDPSSEAPASASASATAESSSASRKTSAAAKKAAAPRPPAAKAAPRPAPKPAAAPKSKIPTGI
jgi:serine/threonine-protein kinase